MNKIIPIVIVGIVIVIGIVVISSTGGISSISYASMTCNELTKEMMALASTTTSTTAESKDQINQFALARETYQSKNCEVEGLYDTTSCTRLLYMESSKSDPPEGVIKAIEDKNCR